MFVPSVSVCQTFILGYSRFRSSSEAEALPCSSSRVGYWALILLPTVGLFFWLRPNPLFVRILISAVVFAALFVLAFAIGCRGGGCN